jgi:hypothetical protein
MNAKLYVVLLNHFRPGKSGCGILTAILSLLFSPVISHGNLLIGVSIDDGELVTVDPATGNETNRRSITGFTIGDELYSIAQDPDSCQFYVIIDSGRAGNVADRLATINVDTGVLSGGVNLSRSRIAGITVGPGGTIYGVLGGKGADAGKIVTINRSTGAAGETGWETVQYSGGGQSIEYNPDDGCLYHFILNGGSFVEKIDPQTGAVTPIGLLSPAPGNPNIVAAAYKGNGRFWVMNISQKIYEVTSSGATTELGTSSTLFRGLARVPCELVGVTGDQVSGELVTIDPLTGGESNRRAVTGFASGYELYSIARDPDSHSFYVIIDSGRSGMKADRLARIDVETGALSGGVNLSRDKIAGVTVGPSGVIHGILGSGSGEHAGKIVTIDKSTGAAAETGWATLQGTTGGQSIEFNPEDGHLYHFSRDALGTAAHVEKVNPATGAATSIGPLDPALGPSPEVAAVTYKGNGEFWIMDEEDLHEVTSGGDTTPLGTTATQFHGIAVHYKIPNYQKIARRAALTKSIGATNRLIRKYKRQLKTAKRKKQRSKVKRIKRLLPKAQRKVKSLRMRRAAL